MQRDTSLLLLLFRLEKVRYAIPLDSVQRVIRSVQQTPLPAGSGHICGVINMHGTILPVIDTRHVLGLPPREIELDDVFIIAQTIKRTVVLTADSVDQIAEISNTLITNSSDIIPELEHLTGLTRLDNDIVLIQDIEKCLTEDDLSTLDVDTAEAGA
ncbi:MAG: chemotaxis protein CheW [Desulfuromonadales bacterium]